MGCSRKARGMQRGYSHPRTGRLQGMYVSKLEEGGSGCTASPGTSQEQGTRHTARNATWLPLGVLLCALHVRLVLTVQ